MSATIIKGTEVAQLLRHELKEEVNELKEIGLTPHLKVILVGEDPASISYVTGKEKAAKEVGISSEVIRLPENTTEASLLKKIHELNADEKVHGILVQLPLPEHIDEQLVIEAISPNKDVDGFHPINIGRMMTNKQTFLPCTPYGIIEMLKSKQIELIGKHAVVIGRSNIVGKPMGQLLLNEDATVTYCHSKTKNMKEITRQADILIVAVGIAEFIDASYVKEGAVVIDVGVNRTEKGLVGDVLFDDVKEVASYITPVPKGVGPMTITMLLVNTVQATKGLHKRAR
ncbi:MAG TPA: bifunctional methylenetetrahydrofolate dehydrogenase/methenyltetrahydrofolate cyclohydrolase FolD [Pseudogracilibacillus sp.]|nr:bifunctional methylenetetrahydrofolate dehydrogenase/methenyltetrahydrofolate cyclohydrolase FolD [Pseudogracilibacillus sp.]